MCVNDERDVSKDGQPDGSKASECTPRVYKKGPEVPCSSWGRREEDAQLRARNTSNPSGELVLPLLSIY
jgi:hypothetical protein